jgi:hypothetical protein
LSAFDKTATALDGTDYYMFSINTAISPCPDILGPVPIIVAILVIGVVALLYLFVYKKIILISPSPWRLGLFPYSIIKISL